jgi:hypothetical protein
LELLGVLLGDDLGPLFKEEDAVELSWVLEAEGEGETPTTRLELSLSVDAAVRATTTDARTAKRERRGWKIHGVLPARRENEQTIQFMQGSQAAAQFKLATGAILLVEGSGIEPSEKGWLFETFGVESITTTTDGIEVEVEIYDRLVPFNVRIFVERVVRFDEANTQFDTLVGNHDDSIVIQEQGNHVEVFDLLPSWVHLHPAGVIQSNDHPDLVLLTRLPGADRVEFRPRLVSDDGRGRRRWRGFDIYVHWGGGVLHHHSQLSFGQKRLIALIWQTGVGDELPLLTDEMTNGLHAGWVQAIIDHLGPRQGFHAVQNPLLLDRYGPGESAAEVAGRFVLCTVETRKRGRRWCWRSPTPEECERLWAAYIAGYQHLSELLISEGLW